MPVDSDIRLRLRAFHRDLEFNELAELARCVRGRRGDQGSKKGKERPAHKQSPQHAASPDQEVPMRANELDVIKGS
jgi:hypothetical protein